MNRNFLRIIGFLIASALLFSMVFAGCGAGAGGSSDAAAKTVEQSASTPAAEATASAPKENVTITFWHTYGDVEEPFFNDNVIPLFEEKFPYIKVEAMRQDGGQFNQLVTTALGTNTTPDVARVDITNLATYANQDALASLDDVAGFAEIKEQVLAGPLSTNSFKGKYYGLPLDTNCKAAVMDMNLMNKLGFTEPPKTMEELIAASMKNSPGKYTINVSGVGDWDTYTYFWLFGGVLTDEGFTKASGYMDSPQSIAALQKMLDLHRDKVFTIRDIDGTLDAWDDKAEYAMFFEGPWYFSSKPAWKDNKKLPSLIPTFNGKSASIVGGQDIVMFKASKHPQEAFEFIKFMLSDTVQTLMASQGLFPVLKTSFEKEQIQKDPVLSVYQKQLETAQTRIPSPQNTAIIQYWSEEITKAFKGEESAEQALKTAAAKIDAELAK